MTSPAPHTPTNHQQPSQQVAALLHFRLPEVTISSAASSSEGTKGGEGEEVVVVHHSFEKEPSALPIHHAPICVSFGLFLEVRICLLAWCLRFVSGLKLKPRHARQQADDDSVPHGMAWHGMAFHPAHPIRLTHIHPYIQGPALIAALDPTNREEAVMGGRLTYAINVHK